MQTLSYIFSEIDRLFESCEIDYLELQSKPINAALFENHSDLRLVNSFLFSYIKIQDKIGAKLFKAVLVELRELEDDSTSMRDVLHRLEKLGIINDISDWDRLREIRNAIAHEYPLDIGERVENIVLALEGYETLKKLYQAVRKLQNG